MKDTAKQTWLYVATGKLVPDPTQPRRTFLKEEIERMAASIRARGILQPLRVKRDDERQCWRIITGECRWRAAPLAGLETLPCIEVDGDVSEAEILADQLIENNVRNSLKLLEIARSVVKLKALTGWNSSKLAAELGLTGAAVTRAEALLTLPEGIQAMVDDGRLPESTAYEISRLPDEQAQFEFAHAVAAKKMSRDSVAEAVRNCVGTRKTTPKASRLAMRPGDGMSVSVTASEPLTWDGLLSALDRIRKEAKKLYEGGKPVTDLAKALKP